MDSTELITKANEIINKHNLGQCEKIRNAVYVTILEMTTELSNKCETVRGKNGTKKKHKRKRPARRH